jgi:hypothetical protein
VRGGEGGEVVKQITVNTTRFIMPCGWGIRSRGTGESDRSNDFSRLGPLETPYVVTTLSCEYYFVPP